MIYKIFRSLQSCHEWQYLFYKKIKVGCVKLFIDYFSICVKVLILALF